MLVCWAIAHIELSRIREKPAEFFVWLACVLSNGCKSLTSPSSGNRLARETRVSVVTRNLKEVSGKYLTQRTETWYKATYRDKAAKRVKVQ